MNVHRKPISEMSTVCYRTCQNARGSLQCVGKLKVGSARIEEFRLHLDFRGHGGCCCFSDDITQNRMLVCSLSLVSQRHTRFVADRGYPCAYQSLPRLCWANCTFFSRAGRDLIHWAKSEAENAREGKGQTMSAMGGERLSVPLRWP